MSLHLVLWGCLPPFFRSSREAAPAIPSLFTLLFSSIYSALQRPGARRSKQLLHNGKSRRVNHTVTTHCGRCHDDCLAPLARPAIVALKLSLSRCQTVLLGIESARGKLSGVLSSNGKTNLKSSALNKRHCTGYIFCCDFLFKQATTSRWSRINCDKHFFHRNGAFL